MMKKKGILRKSMELAVLLGMMAAFAACGSEETVLLEEDLVLEESLETTSELTPDTSQALDDPTEEPPEEQVEQSTLFVHICGEVMEPGVYELPSGSRIYEAVEAAGGFTQKAADSYVNLAQVLQDGWKIEIPAVGDAPAADSTGDSSVIASGGGITANSGITAGNVIASGSGSQQETLVDINTATKAELCSLPGIGESRADSIISYREKHGGFAEIEDIMKVEGIKEGMFEKMKDKICVRGVK